MSEISSCSAKGLGLLKEGTENNACDEAVMKVQ
jgi:hypothetical protein